MYLSPSLSSTQAVEIQQASMAEDARQGSEAQRRSGPLQGQAAFAPTAPTPPPLIEPAAPSHVGRQLDAKA
jgi:hypothetical protein